MPTVCASARDRTVTPHVAVNGVVSKRGVVRRTAVDGRTTRHAGYAVSQRVRKRIEEVFGWKAQAGLAKVKVRGCGKAEAVFTFAVAACNLIRIRRRLQPDPHPQAAGTSLRLRPRRKPARPSPSRSRGPHPKTPPRPKLATSSAAC
jgi:hypothetical protein